MTFCVISGEMLIKHKSSMRSTCINKPSNTLFIKRNTPKLKDLVDLGAAQIMYKAANKYLPHNMQDV